MSEWEERIIEQRSVVRLLIDENLPPSLKSHLAGTNPWQLVTKDRVNLTSERGAPYAIQGNLHLGRESLLPRKVRWLVRGNFSNRKSPYMLDAQAFQRTDRK